MDTVIYWMGILLKLILLIVALRAIIWAIFWLLEKVYGIAIIVSGWSFISPGIRSISVKTTNLELHFSNICLSLRVFDVSCRHLIKVNVAGIHLEYYKRLTGDQAKDEAKREKRKSPSDLMHKGKGKSCWKKFKYWCLSQVLHLVEISVKCLEVLVEDKLTSTTTLIWMLQVSGHLGIIAKPLPNKELAVSMDVDKAAGRFFLQSDRPCPTTDDGLYPLGQVDLSTKVLVFLRPGQRRLIHSIQINTIPLSLSLIHEDVILYAIQHLLALSPKTHKLNGIQESQVQGSQSTHESLPEFEIVLEDVRVRYHASSTNRALASKFTRVTAAAKFSSAEQAGKAERENPLCFNAMIGIQGVSASDSLSRQCFCLKQFLLHTEKSAEVLSNQLQVSSLHGSLWDGEVLFWTKYLFNSLQQTKDKLTALRSTTTSKESDEHLSFDGGGLFSLPVSVVTTVEASDLSLQVRMDSPSLQSKEPVVRGVMAACVGNMQWSPVEDHTSSVRASLRVTDTYLHVPGYHPSVDNPAFFQQRVDDPSILPSLHKHLWGRVASLGCLTLQIEKKVHVKTKDTPSSSNLESGGGKSLDFGREPLVLSGEGNGLMLEWSQPSIIMLAKVLEYYQREHADLFPSLSPLTPEGEKDVQSRREFTFPTLLIHFQLSNINLFMYGLSPEPPSAMFRLDAATLSAPPSPGSTPNSAFSLELHGLLLDDLHLPTSDLPFLCSSVSNLPQGVGVALADTISVKYDHQIKNGEVVAGKVTASWNPTVHRCLFHTATCLQDDIKLIRGVLSNSCSSSTPPTTVEVPEVLPLGQKGEEFLAKVPISLSFSLEKMEGVANLDRGAKVCLELNRTELSLNGGVMLVHTPQSYIHFDQHRIVSVEQLVARFPHSPSDDDQLTGRGKFKDCLLKEGNQIINIQLRLLELVFPYNYNFSQTFDKVMNAKRFLQMLHSPAERGKDVSKKPLVLAPDVLLECNDFIFQICDDPFEVKLRSNYELMCDEYEQKTQRLLALQQKIEEVKRTHGEYAMSGQAVQNFYDSLELKDSEIYCQRAKKMYSSSKPLQTSLFRFSMSGTKILAMFDPSMLGTERLVANLKNMDAISPLPDGYILSTLWGGYVCGKSQKLEMRVRNYPHSLVGISDITISGRIIFAEQEAQEREKRLAVVEVKHPWKSVAVQRKLPPLKYYYDFEMTSSTWDMSYGPCLEPGMAQSSQGFGLLTSPTVDPSRPLAYWDKLRLLFHGTIHLLTNEMRIILPSTFNPYNSVEYLELKMTTLDLSLLTNTKLTLDAAVQLLVHTASKYDECELFNFPKASGVILLKWICSSKDPNRHHQVVRCTPDKLPEKSDKQEHDSYSSFRSQNLDLEFKLDIHHEEDKDVPLPSILLYSSTLRSLQQYQMLLKWNVTRPTKRGTFYKNLKPRRPPMLRHWRDVKVSVSFPRTVFQYWSSRALQRGVKGGVEGATLSLSCNLTLIPIISDLTQRPRANWTITSCSGCGQGIKAYVKRSQDLTEANALKEDDIPEDLEKDHVTSMLLSIEEITYAREDSSDSEVQTPIPVPKYVHKIETTNSRLLWNSSNRNVVLGLYDAFRQTQELKTYLSTEALKSILSKKDLAKSEDEVSTEPLKKGSPMLSRSVRKRQSSSGNTMLDQLLSDITNSFVKYVDESAPSDPQLKGLEAVEMDDITSSNWSITLTNTQVVLQGIEQNGYVVASSHLTNVFASDHEPKLKNGVFVSKSSWVGKIQELQYFTTQSVKEQFTYVPWLPVSVIRPPAIFLDEKSQTDEEANLNALLGTLGPSEGGRPPTPMGEAMGGTVSGVRLDEYNREETQGDSSNNDNFELIQLQRVAPRCHCQVIYVVYGDQVEAEIARSSSPGNNVSPSPGALISNTGDVDTFTFRYPSVEVCTTSYQYALIMDIISNLLLHKELKKKEVIDHHARMKFALQLSSKIKDPRKAVLNQQNKVKKWLQAVRKAETALFLEERKEGSCEMSGLESQLALAKEKLAAASLNLSVLVKTFRQSQLYLTPTRAKNVPVLADPTRRIEIWVDETCWSLSHKDGQLRLADICLTNFSYNRLTFSDDSGEHKVELGSFKLQNLMPNTPPIYKQVLFPYDPKDKHLRVDKNITLRVYCKDKAPVAGIPVKEHLEVNVVPLTVSLTSHFFQTMQDFFFSKEDESADSGDPDHSHLFGPTGVQPSPLYGDVADGNSPLLARGSSGRRSLLSSSSSIATSSSIITSNYSPPSSPDPYGKRRIDDVERMKDRATKTKTFIYIKIPQTPLCITYKSENVSIKDLHNQRVTMPTLEYHNKNWTWTDMLMEVKKDYKTAIVQQTIKSAIGMKRSDDVAGLVSPKMKRHSPSDLLLGHNTLVGHGKSSKSKKLFGRLSSREEEQSENDSVIASAAEASYQPPLMESDINLKRTMRSITELAQNAQKS